VEFVEGGPLRRDVLFAHPAQRQVDVVRALAALDSAGLVQVDEMSRETSTPGIYAAGDLVMRPQQAMLAAASGNLAEPGVECSEERELSLAVTPRHLGDQL